MAWTLENNLLRDSPGNALPRLCYHIKDFMQSKAAEKETVQLSKLQPWESTYTNQSTGLQASPKDLVNNQYFPTLFMGSCPG